MYKIHKKLYKYLDIKQIDIFVQLCFNNTASYIATCFAFVLRYYFFRGDKYVAERFARV
jgi:hypothetical protein